MPSGGGSSGTTQTVQKSDPWSGQQGYLTDVFNQAQNQFQNYKPQYFPGNTVAGFTPFQNQAVQATADVAQNNPTAGNANGAINGYLSGDYLKQGNPYFKNVADTVKANVVPQLESQFSGSSYGLNRPGAAYAVGNGTSDAIGNLAYQDYQNQQGNQLKAAYLAPQVQQMPYTDIAQLYNAGATQQGQNQADINSNIDRFNFGQQLPYNQLNQYANLISGNYGGTSTLTQPYYSNNSGNILGGGLLGASLGSALAPTLGLSGGLATGGGGMLGALAMGLL